MTEAIAADCALANICEDSCPRKYISEGEEMVVTKPGYPRSGSARKWLKRGSAETEPSRRTP